MDILIPKIVAAFVLPPGGILVLAALGLVALARGRRRAAGVLLAGAFAVLLVLSLPAVTEPYLARSEVHPAIDPAALPVGAAQAIVVLGGGRYANAPEYGGDTVSTSTLERIRYGAWLHRRAGLPLLVSGGSVHGEPTSEAELMAKVLREELAVPVRWVEARARNTAENAAYSAGMLAGEGIDTVVLVTSAVHMARAVEQFEGAGLSVIPAPTGFETGGAGSTDLFDWLPRAGSFAAATAMLHEWLGRLWYALRY